VRLISTGRLEHELFGTRDPALVADAVDGFCEAHLGAAVPPDGYLAALATYGGAPLGVRPSPGRAG
jgi:hypothetical protein